MRQLLRLTSTVALLLAPLALPAQSPSDSAPAVTDTAVAADSALEAATTAVAARLRCPVCQGLSIQDSPSPLALEMRDLIKDQLRSGRTPQEVQDYFVAKYGEWILLEPEPTGFNLIVYVVPVLALLGGLAIVWRSVRRWTAPSGSESPAD
ncbi:MAG TPA: cytochrome c-type biogenesis protein [Gemmatimonadaceae bacterium]